jgi:DNA-directed RNA polymerase
MIDRVSVQQELEHLSVQMGIAAYREALKEEGVTTLAPGQQLIRAAMQPMVEALTAWLEVARTDANERGGRSAGMTYFIDQLDPEATAWLTAHAALNMLHERPPLVRVASALALNLEAELNYDAIAAAQPALAAKLARKMDQIDVSRNKALFVRKAGALADVKVVQWDDIVRARAGTLLLQMFSQATGLVAIEETYMRGKSQLVVRPTEACLKWLEEAHARCELLSPYRLPMVCTPRAWTNPFNGGYLKQSLRQPLVKTRNRGYLGSLKDHTMPWVYAAVNALQETEWAVNEPIYNLVRGLWEAKSELGGLPKQGADDGKAELPARSWGRDDTPDPAALHAWKVDAARAHEAHAKAKSKRLQLVQKLWVAEMMMARGNGFHYVYNLDWRGRMYPVGPALTPQGDDVAKAMLRFAQSFRLGDEGAYWLAIHAANAFGVDKVSFEDRIAWVEANGEEILDCGRDPLVHRMWTEADSPFVFLAACMEYAKLDAWVMAGNAQEDFESSLPVAFDGSCNGLQNFSAMLRDPVGGAATGLVPSDKPADIYSEVARAAQALIDADAARGAAIAQRWVGKMTRKLAKRNTMTVPYGVTKRGMKDQLFAELTASDPADRAHDAEYLAECNYTAIGNVVVAARRAMDWLRDAAKVAASTGLPVRWTTPVGFLAVQDYREDVGVEMNFTVLGRRFRFTVQKDGDKLMPRKQAMGISPNFVHSLDAAHLMRTVLFCAQDGITDFAMIHDSYGVHAGHAARLRDNLREAFVEQYTLPVLEQFRDELLAQLPEEKRAEVPPLPPMGDLDLQQVRHSEYFFA